MSHFVNRILSFAFFTVFVAATAATASAQQATFHLPFEAKWGGLVMPAGDYTVKLPEPALGTREVLVRGPAQGFIMVVSTDNYGDRVTAPSNGDYLQLVKIGDVYYVTKFEEASHDTTLFFKAPKQPRPEHMAAREVVNIPVKRS
ncbi:MAG: hypothetical protein WBW33_16105 [Bryobacteraceae bacterium]